MPRNSRKNNKKGGKHKSKKMNTEIDHDMNHDMNHEFDGKYLHLLSEINDLENIADNTTDLETFRTDMENRINNVTIGGDFDEDEINTIGEYLLDRASNNNVSGGSSSSNLKPAALGNYDVLINNIDVIRNAVEQYKHTGLDLHQLKKLITEIQEVLDTHMEKVNKLIEEIPEDKRDIVEEPSIPKKEGVFDRPLAELPQNDKKIDEALKKIRQAYKYFLVKETVEIGSEVKSPLSDAVKYLKLEAAKTENSTEFIVSIASDPLKMYGQLVKYLDQADRVVFKTIENKKKIELLILFIKNYYKEKERPDLAEAIVNIIEKIQKNDYETKDLIQKLDTKKISEVKELLKQQIESSRKEADYKKLGLSPNDIKQRELEIEYDKIKEIIKQTFESFDAIRKSSSSKSSKKNYMFYETEPQPKISSNVKIGNISVSTYELQDMIVAKEDPVEKRSSKIFKLFDNVIDIIYAKYFDPLFLGDSDAKTFCRVVTEIMNEIILTLWTKIYPIYKIPPKRDDKNINKKITDRISEKCYPKNIEESLVSTTL